MRPRSLRDVPAQRLAYSFEADTAPPPGVDKPVDERLASVKADFDTRRTEEALVRTVLSPDGQRALALYETAAEQPGFEFRIDLYGADGTFLRNVTPPELSGAFAPVVAWSPDGNYIAFIGRKTLAPQPTPVPSDATPEELAAANPSASVAPVFAPVQTFSTEQVYICNRDGYDLKPLTTRDGLIYFYLSWAPDNHALAALACKESEWDENEKEKRAPAGRLRLLWLDGREHLLDDERMDSMPVWSPDSSKVATAFETNVAIYDGATDAPTGARIQLYDALRSASAAYDEKNLRGNNEGTDGKKNESSASSPQTGKPPKSFAPIISVAWPQVDTLYLKTGYVPVYPKEPEYPRWHKLILSPQAALLSKG